jgi:two-component system cell cycle response regulator
MRLHRSEAAFFLFIAVLLAVGVVTVHAYSVLFSIAQAQSASARAADILTLSRLLFATGVLLAIGLLFGLFFIFPLIRQQVREENELRAMTESLSLRSRNMERAALTDALTGMQNRRYFDDALKEYLGEFKRVGKPIGLMIVDLDHFKQINDNHGHDAGDEVLKGGRQLSQGHDAISRCRGAAGRRGVRHRHTPTWTSTRCCVLPNASARPSAAWPSCLAMPACG